MTDSAKKLRPYNVLFLGGAKRVSMARLFMRAGIQLGLDVHIFGYELDRRVPLAAVGEIIIGRRWADKDLYTHLHQVVEERGINLLVPFVDPAVGVAARYAAMYGDAAAATSEASLAEAMFDKTAADALFRRCNIPVPAHIDAERPVFPLIAKPRTGSASKGIVVIRGAEEFSRCDFPEEKYLLQEYIADADEYTVDCFVASDGQPKAIVPRRRIEVVGGEVSVTETVRNLELMNLSATALTRLGLTGPVTLQFLHDKSGGRFLLMEINPRLGGGAVCSVYAGANLPAMILSEAVGLPVGAQAGWRDHTRMTRYMQEVVFCGDELVTEI